MLFLCSRQATARRSDKIICRIIINNLCLLTFSQEIWELILGILIIFWTADSYIAINTLIHSCLKSKQHNILRVRHTRMCCLRLIGASELSPGFL
jgi:hypothetical protein